MRIVLGLVLLACAGAVQAQPPPDDSWILGFWSGEIVTPYDDMPRLRVRIGITRERSGEPTARVEYLNLRCETLWTDGDVAGSSWRFLQIRADDCQPEMTAELTRAQGGLRVRWREPGSERIVGEGALRRSR